MNYLAHVFLSSDNDEIIIGNFIGDYIKGSEFGSYKKGIRTGILLHRNIDLFTDTNSIVKQSKSYFYPSYQKYSGIVVDILYDHFLALNWEIYSRNTLNHFTKRLHQLLLTNIDLLPEKVQNFVPSFIENDWIEAYTTIEGIGIVLKKMAKRTTLPDKYELALKAVRKNYSELNNQFNQFFPQIIDFVSRVYELKFPKIIQK